MVPARVYSVGWGSRSSGGQQLSNVRLSQLEDAVLGHKRPGDNDVVGANSTQPQPIPVRLDGVVGAQHPNRHEVLGCAVRTDAQCRGAQPCWVRSARVHRLRRPVEPETAISAFQAGRSERMTNTTARGNRNPRFIAVHADRVRIAPSCSRRAPGGQPACGHACRRELAGRGQVVVRLGLEAPERPRLQKRKVTRVMQMRDHLGVHRAAPVDICRGCCDRRQRIGPR